ncbi:antirestriction protein ArdA [Egbenema bharatensis]|uniref:antirestriction protein ArdA n=1 Tax=Egbenema bharatensis TaxID=3463334 RepID=UPI003A863CDF
MSKQSHPQIYVACLAAYNAGHLHGTWIEFTPDTDAEDVQAPIDEMLKRSPEPDAEEWDIHDSEHFAEFRSHDLELLCQVANLINEHGEGAVKGFIAHLGSVNTAAEIDNFSDIYLGCYQSEADFCEEHFGIAEAAEKIQVFDWATLDQYIDWERIANDAFINSYFSHKEDYQTVHVYTR